MWNIIDLILDETKNVKVSVDDTLINNQEQEDWEFPNKEKKHIEEITNAFLQKGKGGSSINIFDSGTLNVTNH